MHRMVVAVTALLTALAADVAAAQSPTGYWKTVDDKTGNPRSVVYTWKEGETMSGKIVQLYRQPDEEADPFCVECSGDLNKQKIVGLKILSGLEEVGNEWSGGHILDPKNGKTYSCYIEVQDGGKKLKVRGYLGISLLGRTQHWFRVPNPDLNVRSFRLEKDGTTVPIAWERKPEPADAGE
ncbi:MAG: hypothetical protein A3J75_04415 [Acidobacteria bacterium RBG_16_68_9]|nr:MAG: hypothetical protein A3J75_04415 [Acidobacteria bacterium RBG_16_68_9]